MDPAVPVMLESFFREVQDLSPFATYRDLLAAVRNIYGKHLDATSIRLKAEDFIAEDFIKEAVRHGWIHQRGPDGHIFVRIWCRQKKIRPCRIPMRTSPALS